MKPYIAAPATALMVYRSVTKKSLTPLGTAAAVVTAVAHAWHPWSLPFSLLIIFFLAGTRATHVKEKVKAGLTMSATGASGGEGPRTHVQVLANSLVASVLSILHARQLHKREETVGEPPLLEWPADLLLVGIVANYVCVTADTFSSELGILSRQTPRLITSLSLRKVPRGTNGGVTLLGIGAGALGAFVVAFATVIIAPRRAEGPAAFTLAHAAKSLVAMTAWGTLGSIVDSLFGGWFQRSVKDVRSGKIVEGPGGQRVLVSPAATAGRPTAGVHAALLHGEGDGAVEDPDGEAETRGKDGLRKYDPGDRHRKPSFGDERPTRVVESGADLLDNNEVNLLMALSMSVAAMGLASWAWGIPIDTVW